MVMMRMRSTYANIEIQGVGGKRKLCLVSATTLFCEDCPVKDSALCQIRDYIVPLARCYDVVAKRMLEQARTCAGKVVQLKRTKCTTTIQQLCIACAMS